MLSPVGPYYVGGTLAITCSIDIDKAVDVPAEVDTVWIGPQGPVHNDSRSTITVMGYNTTLLIRPLSASDAGSYLCTSNVTAESPYVLHNENQDIITVMVSEYSPGEGFTCMCKTDSNPFFIFQSSHCIVFPSQHKEHQ